MSTFEVYRNEMAALMVEIFHEEGVTMGVSLARAFDVFEELMEYAEDWDDMVVFEQANPRWKVVASYVDEVSG